MKIKSIIISQPESVKVTATYATLRERQKVKVDFRPFIEVKSMNSKHLREQQIKLADFSVIIFTSRNAIDNFFRIAEELKYKVSNTQKYFCISETVAMYLQKYITYRKRKIFIGNRTLYDLKDLLKTHNKETFFIPSSDVFSQRYTDFLNKLKIKWTRGVLYKTVCSDLSDMNTSIYDVYVFFSPSGVESLFKNFPDFEQKNTKIAAFGNTTIEAASKAGLTVDIKAPTKETPSMLMALEKYIQKNNSKR